MRPPSNKNDKYIVYWFTYILSDKDALHKKSFLQQARSSGPRLVCTRKVVLKIIENFQNIGSDARF